MNKEKQIEKIKNFLHNLIYGGFCSKDCFECYNKVSLSLDCEYVANEIYEQGYRKINENEVVISKEEFWKSDKDKIIREMASDMDYACTKHDLWPEDAKEIARVLVTLGYRKCLNNSRCHKCVYEMNCSKDKDNNRQCPNYKKDSPDGGYYG